MTIRFTAKTAKSIAAIPGKRMEYFDAATPGLALRVTEKGVKSWTVLYRHRGKLRRLTLGSLKTLGLADARLRAQNAIRAAGDGKDPASEKQRAKQAETISDLITDYIEKYAQKRKRSWREDQRILNNEVLPHWKHRAIADIKRRDVRTLLEPIAERGAATMANRVLACVRKMFSFAVDQELIERNPAARLGRPGGAEQSRDRVLTDVEIRQLWKAFTALSPEMGAFFKLRLVTAQRGKEVSSMRWQDVNLESGWWTIPAAVAKNKLAHRVPLSVTAVDIIKALHTEGAKPDAYVLAGARGRRQQSEAAATFTVEDFRGHDLRRTAASLMAGGGIPRLTIKKILNHVERDITAIYDRHGYDAEKRAALDWWALKLTAILDEKPAKVLAFSGKGA